MLEVLNVLAGELGIEPEYQDNWGRIFRTHPDTAYKILNAKGISIDPTRLKNSRQVVVISSDRLADGIKIILGSGPDLDPSKELNGKLHLRESQGKLAELTFRLGHGADLDKTENGTWFIKCGLPEHLETGPYRFTSEAVIDDEKFESELFLIVCPPRAYLPEDMTNGRRAAGVWFALYGIRSENNWGVGDFGDLIRIISWAADDLKVDFIGLNPLHSLFNRKPYGTSPYNPSSRFFRNLIYLDIPSIPDFAISPKAGQMTQSDEFRNRIKRLRDEDHVNYEEVSTLKIEILREVFRTFMANQGQTHLGSDRWSSFQEYIEAQGQYLEKYATFCALHDYFGTESPLWPEEYRNPESNEVKKFQRMNEEPILFWKYVQWQLEEQLRGVQEHARTKGMLIGLYNDEALAVDRNGADFWALRDFFHDGFRVGAPPDAFAPDGQDWGFPPPDRDRLRSAGYEPFVKKLETSCKFSGALRIDHVMQLYHLFWIPQDGKAKDGVYVKDFEPDLLNLIALVSQQTQTIIIGEDLGTVPFDFRDRLMEKGIFSYRVFYFERDKAQNLLSPSAYPESALVTISTHDLPTLAGFWSQLDIDVRKKIGQISEEREEEFRRERTDHKAKIIEKLVQENLLPAETAHAAWESPFPTENLHKAVLAFVLNTPSKLVVINQEDIFLDTKQQNFPGTTSECPNWSTKMRFTLEDFYSNDECRSLWERVRDLVEASGRSMKRQS